MLNPSGSFQFWMILIHFNPTSIVLSAFAITRVSILTNVVKSHDFIKNLSNIDFNEEEIELAKSNKIQDEG